LFATENRMRANGIAGCAGRITGILAPQLVVVLFATGGVKQVLMVIVGVLIAMVVVLTAFGVETNQRSLEDIAPEPEADTALGATPLPREPHR
jgi:MFS transporter, putative metabolite:H+ symporter